MKRKISKVLVTGLAALMLASCTGTAEPASAPATATTAPTAAPAAATPAPASAAPATASAAPSAASSGETVSLSVSMPNFGIDPVGTPVQDEWLKRSEAYLGVKLDIKMETLPLADYTQKEKLVLASNDLPDIFVWTSYGDINNYGDQGTVFNLAPMLESGQLPNYQRFVEETPFGTNQVYTVEGNMFGFQSGFYNPENIEGAQSYSTVAYRFDILKEHGLSPASTIDEFYELCVKLKELYPDNYIITSQDKNNPIYRGFDGSFHVRSSTFWDGSQWIYGPITENFKELLAYFNKLWEADVIDPEFISDDNAAVTQKALTGRIFIQPSVWAGNANHYNNNSVTEGMEWGLAFLPTNEKYGVPWKTISQQRGRFLESRMGNAISAKSEHAELCAKLLDYEFSDEMIELIDWGIEGLSYQKADGKNEFLPEFLNATDPAAELGKLGVASSMVCRTGIVFVPQDLVANWQMLKDEPWWHDGEYTMNQYWFATNEYGGPESVQPLSPIVQLTPDEATEASSINNVLNQYRDEAALQFITGEKDIETEWDAYVDQLSKLGDYNRILELNTQRMTVPQNQ